MHTLNKIRTRLTFTISVFTFFSCMQQNPDAVVSQISKLTGARPVIDAMLYPTLQDAIDAVPATGGMVRIPPGEFEITEPLVIQVADFQLEGSGTSSHIINKNAEGQPALILQHPSKEESDEAELWRISLKDFRITGNENSGNGIEARRINEVFINGVTVSYHGGDGILLHYCYEDPRISNCLITYNKKTGLNLVACHDIVVSANQFEENFDALRCIDSYNLCMNGNNLDDHLGNGVVIENTYGSVVAGNMIEECSGVAVIMDRDSYGNTVSANVIAHNVSGGVDLRDAHGCAVSANTFTIMGKDAVRIGPESGRILVSGNNFSDSYVGEGKMWREPDDLNAGGLVLEGTSKIGIVGNMFSGVKPAAIELRGKPSREINFSGNVLIDTESGHKELMGSVAGNNLESK